MRVAVAGGTGHIGRLVVGELGRAGHECVVLARSAGFDLVTGEGLAAALRGVDSVIDVTNTASNDREATRAFFRAVTRNLLAAEEESGVGQHVLLSIVGVDRVEGNAHFTGKRVQEELVRAGSIPSTIVRATEFHDFATMVVRWTRRDDTALVPPLLVQPIAPADVAAILVEVATGPRSDDLIEIAGPEPQDLVDMARRTLAARGEVLRLIPSWRGPFGVEAAGEVLLPGREARIAPTTFESWLETHQPPGSQHRKRSSS